MLLQGYIENPIPCYVFAYCYSSDYIRIEQVL